MLVHVIIPTYNRLKLLQESLNSVLIQQVGPGNTLKITVSDNSTNDDTEAFFKNTQYEKVIYIRRRPSVKSLEHIQLALREVDGDLFMIFHDDDVMGPDMLLTLINSMSQEDAAITGNAFKMTEFNDTELYHDGLKAAYKITTNEALLRPYLERQSFVPFPGYLYKKDVSEVELNYRFGKHIDVNFLSEVLKYGAISIIDKPLYKYRVHQNQDSFVSDFAGKSYLIRYIINTCNINRTDKVVVTCRLYSIYDEFRTLILGKKNYDNARIRKFFMLCLKSGNPVISLKLLFYYLKNIL